MQSDAFAVLGVPVTAPYAEVLDRYGAVKELLEQKATCSKSQAAEFATQNIELVEQSFRALAEEDSRIQVIRQMQEQVIQTKLQPKSFLANAILSYPTSAVTAFYESAIDDLKILQYWSLNNIEFVTNTLHDLNLAYLLVQMDSRGEGGQAVVRSPLSPQPSFGTEAKPDIGLSTVP
jgi:hypothetical protein